jgi:RND superfamily putative drug exporter
MRASNTDEPVAGPPGGGGDDNGGPGGGGADEGDHYGAVGAVFAAIGRFSVRFRWLVVVVWLAGTVAAAHFLPSLASVTNSDNADFLPASAPSAQAQQLSAAFQKANVQPITVIVATRDGGQLTPADQQAVDRLRTGLGTVSGVVQVRDTGQSKDQQAEQLQALVRISPGPNGQKPVVDGLHAAVTSARLPAGLQAHLTGQVAAQVDNQAANGNTGNKLQYLSVALILVLLLLIFRSLLAPVVTLAPAFLVVTLAGPLVAAAADAGLKVSPLAQFLMIVLILGAGTDYGLFLMFRVREEMGKGLDHRAAVVRAVARVGESVTFSAGTVIAALVSLLAASFGLYADLGVPLAIGIGVMLVAALTLLPALLAILGRGVFWPARIRSGAGSGVWGRISARIVQRPVVTLVAGLVLFGGLAVASIGYQSSGFGGGVTAPSGSDSAAGADLQAEHFPSLAASPTSVLFRLPRTAWSDPQVLADAQRRLAASGQFTRVTGPLNPNGAALPAALLVRLHDQLGPAQALPPVPQASARVPAAEYQAYRASAQYISADGHTVQYLVGLAAGDPSTTEAMNAVPGIRDAVTTVAHDIGATDSGVAGAAPAVYDISSISNSDLGTVIPIAILIIGVLLALVMRSVVAPLYLIASVGLSYLAALGLAVLLFIKLGGTGGLTFFMPFLMFIFLLALGEDYNILVMSRIREEAHGLPLRRAITKALSTTGTTVTSAGLILAGTFAVFAVAGGSMGTQIRDIGVGLALGILMDTFLVRTLLVPSTAVLLGRWNWWPSRLGRRGAAPEEPPGADTPADPVPVGSGSS